MSEISFGSSTSIRSISPGIRRLLKGPSFLGCSLEFDAQAGKIKPTAFLVQQNPTEIEQYQNREAILKLLLVSSLQRMPTF